MFLIVSYKLDFYLFVIIKALLLLLKHYVYDNKIIITRVTKFKKLYFYLLNL